eukprot:TRINITY_DN16021_c0_g7_i1.p1 TRINITY_DN16021_c0_g7~~TRINITY_DN16021_c0_g7_i1.p1  ORF type:complete len:109 (-),score=8.32 TRINITY_DN16021_c0_g7_i1:407-733(-)
MVGRVRSSSQDLKQGSKTIVEYYEEFMTMQVRCGLNEADDVLVEKYFHELRIDIQHILVFKFLKMLMRSSNLPSRPRTLPIINPENSMCLNGLHRRPHQCKILNQVVH